MADDQSTPPLPPEVAVLPLRGTVSFPLSVQPLAVNRPVSVESVNRALGGDRMLLLVLQEGDADDPTRRADETHRHGRRHPPDGRGIRPALHIIVEGIARVRADVITRTGLSMRAVITAHPRAGRTQRRSGRVRPSAAGAGGQGAVARQRLLAGAPRRRRRASTIRCASRTCSAACSTCPPTTSRSCSRPTTCCTKLEAISAALAREIALLEVKGKIESQAQQEMTDAQRQYYLRQQLKAIQEELGEGEARRDQAAARARREGEAAGGGPARSPAARSIASRG